MSADCPRCVELAQGLSAANKLYGEQADELGEVTKKAAQWHQRMLLAKSRIVQLEAALRKHGSHVQGCRYAKPPGSNYVPAPNEGCSCGLDTILRGTPDG